MTRNKTLLLCAVSLLLCATATAEKKNSDSERHPSELKGEYIPADYMWTTPSLNASESMPCGGHDIGLNVWVEEGDLLIYMTQSGWFDENNTLLKAGRLRLRFNDAPFSGTDFRQTLCLDQGSMSICGSDLCVKIWVDTYSPIIYVDIDGRRQRHATLSYESWRQKDRRVPSDASQQNTWKWLIADSCITKADIIEPSAHSLTFSHINDTMTVFDFTVSVEGLDSIKDQLYNPIGGRQMRGVISCPGFSYTGTSDSIYADTDYRAWNYEADIKKSSLTLTLTTSDHDASAANIVKPKVSAQRSAQWWHAFWQRSYISLPGRSGEPESTDTAAVIVRNYELMRYMLGCNARGFWPTKFNGGLFTFDPLYVDAPRTFTPDYRCWGGGTMTSQNQRLVYWPMVKSGDADMLRVELDTYLRMLGNARLRTQFYWHHDGASYCEQIENFGLPNPAEYGTHEPGQDRGVENNAWLEYMWDTSLEFCQMAMEAHRYLGMDIRAYEEMIMQCLIFFDRHYQYQALRFGAKALTEDGKLILYPGSGGETYKMAYNACSTVAALQTVSASMAGYLAEMNDTARQHIVEDIAARVPDIPLRQIAGHTVIAPAVVWSRIQNVETTQMYPVFPWRIFGLGRPNLQVAIDTWNIDPWALQMRSEVGWKQDNIWAACIGDTEEAVRLNYLKMRNGPYRFPAFYDMGFDWAPDFNRGGSGMIGIQEMLMQHRPDGSRIELPAWPARWGKVYYKLH